MPKMPNYYEDITKNYEQYGKMCAIASKTYILAKPPHNLKGANLAEVVKKVWCTSRPRDIRSNYLRDHLRENYKLYVDYVKKENMPTELIDQKNSQSGGRGIRVI